MIKPALFELHNSDWNVKTVKSVCRYCLNKMRFNNGCMRFNNYKIANKFLKN